MESPLEGLKDKLAKRPELKYIARGNYIRVEPHGENGFSASIFVSGSQATVSFDGWHATFSSIETALEYFARGFSDHCRLRVSRRGDFEHMWTLEYLVEGVWLKESTVGLHWFPFWRREEVVIRQNVLLRKEEVSARQEALVSRQNAPVSKPECGQPQVQRKCCHCGA